MNRIIKHFSPILIFFLALIGLPKIAIATHIMGGEITWECQNNGQYIFTLKVYRDCNGIAFATTNHALEAHNYPTVGQITQIPLTFFSVTDITPSCEGSPCATLSQSDPDIQGAIEEYVLKSAATTLNGVAPNNGWTFSWTYGDRNAAIDNIVNAQNFGITLRAKMFSPNGQNANPCFDNSPDFFQKPSTIICAGEKFIYNHSAFDNELDSLSYSWAQPLDGNFCTNRPCTIGSLFQDNTNPVILTFDTANGYQFDSPYPDTSQDSRNIPAVLDANTGEITFTSFNTGEYVSVIRVEAFKCGDKVAEIYRELQTVIASGCASNEPPIINPPFANGTFSDTVIAGDFIDININVFDTLRTDNPKNDSIFFYASGFQFGANYTDSTSGCLNPPCATLGSNLPDTAVGQYSTNFRWQTSCDHIASTTPTCVSTQNTHTFVIRAFDDFCPAAGQAIASISITILAETLVPHPDIHCADVQSNGHLIIDWNQTSDPDNAFAQWKIYRATNRSGPYTLIDSIADYNTTTFTDSSINANLQSFHYIVRAESSCHDNWFYLPTDTISSMFINPTFNGTCIDIAWNAIDDPLPSGSGTNYEIYREYPIGSGFVLYQSTTNLSICDTFNVCTDTVTYRIDISNTGNGCSGSASNIQGIRFQYAPPIIDAGNTIDICNGQSAQIGGLPSAPSHANVIWSPNDSIDNINAFNPIVNPSDTSLYYLSVTDSNNCTSMDSVLVQVRPSPVSFAGLNDSICKEDLPYALNGSVSVSNTGQWIGGNGNFNPNRNTLNATYQPTNAELTTGFVDLELISTNVGICDVDSNPLRISFPPFVASFIMNTTNVSCNGGNDGNAKININGINSPYSFQWNTNTGIQNGDSVASLNAGTFKLTITNRLGCDSIISFSISEPSPLSLTTSQINESCNGLNDGSAIINPTGGTIPYTYLWSNNQITDTASFLSAGNYTVSVTDNNSCTITTSFTITEPSQLTSSISNSVDVSCNGLSDGTATVNPAGGTPPYSYSWSNNQTTMVASNLIAGSYTVTVSDNNACTSISSLSIGQPANLSIPLTYIRNVSCFGGNDGQLSAFPSGGTSPYTFQWSDNQSADTAKNLMAGNYGLTITDNNGCTSTTNLNVGQASILDINISSSFDVSCNGLADGQLKSIANGGTPPYTYLWSNNQTQDSIIGLTSGTYTVTLTDNNACTDTASASINQPSALGLNFSTIVSVSCNGLSDGSATINVNGGTTPYTYNWSNGSNTDTANNLSAGTYRVSITDINSCIIVDSIVISEPAILTTSISSSIDVSCNGLNDGRLKVAVSGGTTPYSYNWSNGQSADSAINLLAGIYTVTITDNNGCTDSISAFINQPPILVFSQASIINVSCNGFGDGSAKINISGGSLPFTYNWSNGQNTDSITNLSAGIYSFTITDNNACELIDSISIQEPITLNANFNSIITASCNGVNDGSASVSASGGTIPYTYLWSNNQSDSTAINLLAGTYTVTITDSNGCSINNSVVINEPAILSLSIANTFNATCNGASDGSASVNSTGGTSPYTYNWSNGQTTDSATGLSAGRYRLTITDSNACSDTISINIGEPQILNSTIQLLMDASCNGLNNGMAVVATSGGTLPYSYAWSDGQITDTAFQLLAGNYTVTITDNNGCSDTSQITINQPAVLTSSLANITHASCNGLSDGKASINASGGSIPYSFLWSNGSVLDSATGLSAGNYTVTITDFNSCTDTISLTINEPIILSINFQNTVNVSCNGLSDGSALSRVNGGTLPYTYLWSNGHNNDSLTNVTAGIYSVTVTDNNSCSIIDSITITEPSILNAIIQSSVNASCNGTADALAIGSASGGVSPYGYAWSNGQFGDTNRNLSAGTYTLSAIDANACVDTISIQITQPNALTISNTDAQDVSCFGLADGWATTTINGGTTPYSYDWNNGQTTDTAFNLSAGIYRITVTDFNSCTEVQSISISEPTELTSTTSGNAVSCFAFADGQASINSSGGSLPYTYLWSNGLNISQIDNLDKGRYAVTITDNNNCIDTNSFLVTEPDEISLSLTTNDTVCVNVPKTLRATASGGNGNYTFSWSENLGNNPIINVSPQSNTTYTVTVTDINNCPEQSDSVRLTVRNLFDDPLSVSSSGDICSGDSALLSYDFQGDFGNYTLIWQPSLNSNINPQYVSPNVSTNYILSVLDVCGNRISDTVLVQVSDPPPINLTDTLISGCEDLTVSFGRNNSDELFYRWEFGDGFTSVSPSPTHTYIDPGFYTVKLTVSTQEGCENQSTVNHNIRVHPTPIVRINASTRITDIDNSTITFLDQFRDASNWLWNFGNGQQSQERNPVVNYLDTGSYWVSLRKENEFGCRDSSAILIRINPNYQIKIPNVFTPNTNGPNGGAYNPNSLNNEVFHPFVDFTQEYELLIFNRWGELIFESKDVNIGWDGYYKGKLSQSDVYVYQLNITFINGDKLTKVGDVTLLR